MKNLGAQVVCLALMSAGYLAWSTFGHPVMGGLFLLASLAAAIPAFQGYTVSQFRTIGVLCTLGSLYLAWTGGYLFAAYGLALGVVPWLYHRHRQASHP